jgi:AcrR family transcriptional regulator
MPKSAAGEATVRRQRNPRGEGARLRTELIEAAARLLESSGDAHAVTLTAVAREAGIAAPSIYRHFADRDQILEAVVADRFRRLDDALCDAITSAPDPAAALRACCHAYCRFGLEHPGHYQVLFGARLPAHPAQPIGQASEPAVERPGARVFGRLVAAVQACIDDGSAGPGDAGFTAVSVWVALHGIVSLRTSRPNHPWPPVTALVAAALSGQVGV